MLKPHFNVFTIDDGGHPLQLTRQHDDGHVDDLGRFCGILKVEQAIRRMLLGAPYGIHVCTERRSSPVAAC